MLWTSQVEKSPGPSFKMNYDILVIRPKLCLPAQLNSPVRLRCTHHANVLVVFSLNVPVSSSVAELIQNTVFIRTASGSDHSLGLIELHLLLQLEVLPLWAVIGCSVKH